MAAQNRPEPYEIGMLVKIRDSGYPHARIVEVRGNLGPQGARVYRLMVRRKPSLAYIEVREDQIDNSAAIEPVR